LKPENIIIDKDGYIKLTDFGLAKENVNNENKATSFCGTPEYLAPEIIEKVAYGKEVDWWSLGVIIFEMIVGRPPFYNPDRNKLFRSILNLNLRYPNDMSVEAKNLMKSIFVKSGRLGQSGAHEIKQHPFFSEINWDSILKKKIRPPFIPNLNSSSDTKYIDTDFLDQPAIDSYNDSDIINSQDDMFKDFSKDINFLTHNHNNSKINSNIEILPSSSLID
jgi:serine/threonine protein kinase